MNIEKLIEKLEKLKKKHGKKVEVMISTCSVDDKNGAVYSIDDAVDFVKTDDKATDFILVHAT